MPVSRTSLVHTSARQCDTEGYANTHRNASAIYLRHESCAAAAAAVVCGSRLRAFGYRCSRFAVRVRLVCVNKRRTQHGAQSDSTGLAARLTRARNHDRSKTYSHTIRTVISCVQPRPRIRKTRDGRWRGSSYVQYRGCFRLN